MSQLFVRTGIDFSTCHQALEHIGQEMLVKGVVHETWPQALLAREADFPTGIALQNHAVAIPHCEAMHAKSPAIYLIRPQKPVLFRRADDDGEIPVSLIIALIVENPTAQLTLLRRLFSELQNPDALDALLAASDSELGHLFQKTILDAEPCAQA